MRNNSVLSQTNSISSVYRRSAWSFNLRFRLKMATDVHGVNKLPSLHLTSEQIQFITDLPNKFVWPKEVIFVETANFTIFSKIMVLGIIKKSKTQTPMKPYLVFFTSFLVALPYLTRFSTILPLRTIASTIDIQIPVRLEKENPTNK